MAIDVKSLTKGEVRKLNALRKSIGDKLAHGVFSKWLKQKTSAKSVDHVDPVAEKIAEAVKPLAKDKSINLGRYGYSIKRARGKGAKGIVVARIEKK